MKYEVFIVSTFFMYSYLQADVSFFFWFFLWTVCWLETFVPGKSSMLIVSLKLSYLHHVLNFLGTIQTRLVRNKRNFLRAWLQVWQSVWSSMIFFCPVQHSYLTFQWLLNLKYEVSNIWYIFWYTCMQTIAFFPLIFLWIK